MPAFEPLARVECDGLMARAWELDGRSGISLSAGAIRMAGAQGNGSGTKAAARTAVVAGASGEG
jgi:hypothetical protein